MDGNEQCCPDRLKQVGHFVPGFVSGAISETLLFIKEYFSAGDGKFTKI